MDQFVLNATTCASATIITHPIELVKTRMQTQGELTRTYTRTYSGTAQSLVLVARSDGFFSLWKGINVKGFRIFWHDYFCTDLANELKCEVTTVVAQ